MAFAAIYIPNFPIQAVVRSEPELAIRPLALIDGPAPTYSVIATNRLAAHLGVTEGWGVHGGSFCNTRILTPELRSAVRGARFWKTPTRTFGYYGDRG